MDSARAKLRRKPKGRVDGKNGGGRALEPVGADEVDHADLTLDREHGVTELVTHPGAQDAGTVDRRHALAEDRPKVARRDGCGPPQRRRGQDR